MDDFEDSLREAEKECAEILGMELDEFLDCVKGDNGNMYFDEGEEMEKLLEYMEIKKTGNGQACNRPLPDFLFC